MKKVGLLLLIGIALSGILWAGGRAEKTSDGSDLTGNIVWSDAEEGTDYTALNQEFMAKYPGAQVEHEFIDPDRAIQIRIASRQMPDIYRNHNQQISPADYADFNVPLDDLGFSADNLIGFDSGIGPDGKVYFLPAGSIYVGMHYNKEVFRNAGIEEFPRTMDEFWIACEKLKKAGVVPLGTGFKDGWPMMPYFGFLGEDVAFDISGNVNFHVELAESDNLIAPGGYLDSINFLREMKERGYLDESLYDASWSDLEKGFASGKYGMFYHGSWFTRVISEQYDIPYENLGLAPFPGSKIVTAIADGGLGVWKDSSNIPLAKEFLKFVIEEGRLSRYGIVEPALIGDEPNNPLVNELISYSQPLQSPRFGGEVFRNRVNKAEIDTIAFLQNYLVTDKPDEAIKEANRKWKNAR